MPQVAFQLQAPSDPFDVQAAGGNTVSVSAAVAITVNWDPGASSLITATPVTQAKTPGGVAAVDSTLDLYLIVAQVGQTTLTLVKLADALSTGIDAVLGGTPSWGIIGELTHNRVREHPQGGDALLVTGIVPFAMAHNDTVVGKRREISLNDNADIVITATDDPTDDRVDYSIDLSAAVKAVLGGGPPATVVVSDSTTLVYSTDGGSSAALTSSTGAKALSLYNAGTGGENTPPSGWQTPTFNDSGWGAAVVANINGAPGPSNYIWPSVTGHNLEQALFRQHFTAPAGITSFTSTVVARAGYCDACYVNGHQVIGSSDTITIPIAWLHADGITDNVLAIWIDSHNNGAPFQEFVEYSISGEIVLPTPPNWQQAGFDASAWTAAVTAGTDSQPLPAGATPIWHTVLPISDTETNLFRRTFTLPPGLPTLATITVYVDDQLDGIWINGTQLAGSVEPSGLGTVTFTIPTNVLQAGASNVLTIQANNTAPVHAFLAYRLSVTTANAIAPGGAYGSLPPGTEGNMLIYHGGAWVTVPAGTVNNQTLHWVVGGIPTWS